MSLGIMIAYGESITHYRKPLPFMSRMDDSPACNPVLVSMLSLPLDCDGCTSWCGEVPRVGYRLVSMEAGRCVRLG